MAYGFPARASLAGRGIGLEEGAAATVALLERAGFQTEVWRQDGAAPVVFGETGDGPATLLIYDHYDVQPAEPLELWASPPFEPQVRDGILYARGTSDNRGEIAARVAAVHTWRETMGPLPLRLKFFIEGEEEVGSLHLGEYVQRYRHRINADAVLWEGGELDESGRPAIALGGKGIAYVEFHAAGPATTSIPRWPPSWRTPRGGWSRRFKRCALRMAALW